MNHISEVAKMLGVELGERFQIINNQTGNLISEHDYYFSNKDIEIAADGKACSGDYILIHLVYGDFAIVRKPWVPNLDEEYYYVDETGYIASDPWCNSALDIILYKIGNCYKTEEDAVKDRVKWLEFYKSYELLEV